MSKTEAPNDEISGNAKSRSLSLPQLKERWFEIQERIVQNSELCSDPYLNLGRAIVEKHLQRLSSPEIGKLQTSDWNNLQITELSQVLDAIECDLRDVQKKIGVYKHFDGFDRLRVDQYPFKFGYGHFAQIDKDRSFFKEMHVGLVQQEAFLGVMQDDFKQLGASFADVETTIRRLLENSIRTDLMMSPHYLAHKEVLSRMPANTSMEIMVSPDSTTGAIVGMPYNIDHPFVREVLENWYRDAAARTRELPGLYTYALSNEPTYASSGRDEFSRPAWTEWLKKKHGNLENLNTLYSTSYKTWEEIPVPPLGPVTEGIAARKLPPTLPEKIAYYDWVIFNQEHFAEWHTWLDRLIKQEAPEARTHAKMMSFFTFDQSRAHLGIDPELMCLATDIAGCDEYTFLKDGPDDAQRAVGTTHGDVYQWPLSELSYELMHSIKNQRVFNSENHLIPDDSSSKPGQFEHIYAALWQGALHHLTDTTVWVWEESHNDTGLKGSIYFRPWNAYQAGRANLDINRLHREITLIRDQKREVAFLYSPTAIYWDADYGKTLVKSYMALSTSGYPVTFLTDRKLQAGDFGEIKYLVLPAIEHLPTATHLALQTFVENGGKLIGVGTGWPGFDEYNREMPIPDSRKQIKIIPADGMSGALRSAFRNAISQQNEESAPQLLDVATGEAPAGCQFYIVPKEPGKWLVAITNLKNSTSQLKVSGCASATNLINGSDVSTTAFAALPGRPILLEASIEQTAQD